MILDNLLMFTGTSNGASAGITSGANTDKPTTGTQTASNILDLGVTSGVPSSGSGGGARDIGIGDAPMMKLLAQVIVAFTVGTTFATSDVTVTGRAVRRAPSALRNARLSLASNTRSTAPSSAARSSTSRAPPTSW